MAWFRDGEKLLDWTLQGLLVTPEGVELQHVRHAERVDGLQGVVKIARGGKGGVGRARLVNEITAMRRLSGVAGVLPVLDSAIKGNVYLITPAVQALREHLGLEPNLRHVIEEFAGLAETLAALQHQGVHHRDLKPENLFWDGSRAVLADFGLVLDPHSTQTSVTNDGEMLGSIYFMAPEARSSSSGTDWGLADVYSLAMSLWVLARGARWPEHSTLWGREQNVTLYYDGGEAADDLSALLQRATERVPYDRLTMREFSEELRAWLRLHPSTTRIPRARGGSLFGAYVEGRAAQKGMVGLAKRSLILLTWDIRRLLPPTWGEFDHRNESGRILEAPDITRGNPDWDAAWGPVTVAREFRSKPGHRLVLELVGDSEQDGYYFAEWQTFEGGAWAVFWFMPHLISVTPRFPSDREVCSETLAPMIATHAPVL